MDDLESRVGGRWLLYTGIAILLIGVSFFLKYAFDNAWIDERGRVGFRRGRGVRVDRHRVANGAAAAGVRPGAHGNRPRHAVSRRLRRTGFLWPDWNGTGVHADGRHHGAGDHPRRPVWRPGPGHDRGCRWLRHAVSRGDGHPECLAAVFVRSASRRRRARPDTASPLAGAAGAGLPADRHDDRGVGRCPLHVRPVGAGPRIPHGVLPAVRRDAALRAPSRGLRRHA